MKGQRPKLIIGSAKHELIRVVDAVIDHASSFGVETDKYNGLLVAALCASGRGVLELVQSLLKETMLLSKLDKGMSLKETQLRVEDREKTTADIVKGNVTKISSGLAHWAQTCMNRLDSLDASLRRSAKRVGTLKRGRAGPPQQLLESPTLGLHVSTHASSAGVGNFYHSSRGGVDGGAAGQHTFSRTRSNGSNSSRTSSNASIVSRGRRKGALLSHLLPCGIHVQRIIDIPLPEPIAGVETARWYVKALVAGGSAERGGQIKEGDMILKVRGRNASLLDLADMHEIMLLDTDAASGSCKLHMCRGMPRHALDSPTRSYMSHSYVCSVGISSVMSPVGARSAPSTPQVFAAYPRFYGSIQQGDFSRTHSEGDSDARANCIPSYSPMVHISTFDGPERRGTSGGAHWAADRRVRTGSAYPENTVYRL